jgi:hypothetical protein
MNQPDPERFLLCQDIFWRLVSNPGTKYDKGSLEAACDVAFAAASVYFARLKDEKARVEGLEMELLKAEVASQLVATNAKQPEPISPMGRPSARNDHQRPRRRKGRADQPFSGFVERARSAP